MDDGTRLSIDTATVWFSNFIFHLVSQNLLSWLRCRKEEGYFIVGLEQTSSSVSLSEFEFPDRPTVLLLGKEKEGIPVEFLQEVELCLEIPQLGIIRSMNVHVSGAIAIWEHTRQKIAQGKLSSS
jgi:tRNA guanosine-2'-O-methyltransferase